MSQIYNHFYSFKPDYSLAMTGWGLDVFTYSYHWWVVPILATHTGAIIGAWIYYLAIGINLRKQT